MIAGLPGTGIGGVFYIVSAVFMPLHRALRGGGDAGRSWQRVALQFGIAVGILGAIFATGWLLGLLIAPHARVVAGGLRGRGPSDGWTWGVARWVAVAGTAGVLALVLLLVEAAALAMRRHRPPSAAPRPVLPALDAAPLAARAAGRPVARAAGGAA